MISPKFDKCVVQSKRSDGYWVEPFQLDPKDKAPGLIAYDINWLNKDYPRVNIIF